MKRWTREDRSRWMPQPLTIRPELPPPPAWRDEPRGEATGRGFCTVDDRVDQRVR